MSKLDEITVKKLGKLLPLLTSDQPGEVAATVAAILRTLGKAGHSMHDLVSTLDQALTPQVVERIVYRERVVVEEKIVYRDRAPAPDTLSADDVITLGVLMVEEKPLSERERDFILNMVAMAAKEGKQFSMSPKQRIWFRDLSARPVNAGASH